MNYLHRIIIFFLSIVLTPLASAEMLTCFNFNQSCVEQNLATDQQFLNGIEACFNKGSIPVVGVSCELLRSLLTGADNPLGNCINTDGTLINGQNCEAFHALFNGALLGSIVPQNAPAQRAERNEVNTGVSAPSAGSRNANQSGDLNASYNSLPDDIFFDGSIPAPNAKVNSNSSNVSTTAGRSNTAGATLNGQVNTKPYNNKTDNNGIPDIFNDSPASEQFIGFDARVWEEGIGDYGACYKTVNGGKAYAPNERYGKAYKLCKPGEVIDYNEVRDCTSCLDPDYTRCRTHFKVLCSSKKPE